MKKSSIQLILLGLGALALIHEAPGAVAAGTLTLPSSSTTVNSWFDHNSPGGGDNSNMIRYDGATWTDGSASIDPCTLTVNCYDGHAGIDFQLASDSNIVSAADGVVKFVGWQDPQHPEVGFGFYVRVWHAASGYSTLYGHLTAQYLVSVDQSVGRGAVIAKSDNTGESTGAHLHFGVYNSETGWTPMDPYGWSGSGSDPWTYDQGYLWTTNPPSSQPPYYWHAWQDWGPVANPQIGGISHERPPQAEHTDMVWNLNTDIYRRYYDGTWSPWINETPNISNPVFDGAVAISNHGGEVNIVGVAQGNLWHKWKPIGGSWNNWTYLNKPPGAAINGPVAVANFNGSKHIAVIASGNIWFKHWYWNGSGWQWSGWQNLGGAGTLGASIAIADRSGLIHIVAFRTADATVWMTWWNGVGPFWQPLQNLGGMLDGGLAVDNSYAVSGNTGTSHVGVHVMALSGGAVHLRCWDSYCPVNAWENHGPLFQAPLAITNTNSEVHMLAISGYYPYHRWRGP